jgi:hypothetical protein
MNIFPDFSITIMITIIYSILVYLVEWAIAAHGMYESLIFNQFLS